MAKINQLLWRIGPALLWAGVIFAFSSISTLPSGDKIWWDFVIKKLAHMFEFAVLYYLVVRALGSKSPQNYQKAFIICILYAISDEIHQSFTPGRYPKITDVGFDTLGMIVAYLRLNRLI